MENTERQLIEINGKTYVLVMEEFDSNIDIKYYLDIDSSNLQGQLMTFPLVMNKIGNLKAEVGELVSLAKMNLESIQFSLEKDYKLSRLGAKTTIADVESHVKTHEKYVEAKTKLIGYEKNLSQVESLYWSAKSKHDVLMNINQKLMPEEFSSEILEKSINNVLFKRVRV